MQIVIKLFRFFIMFEIGRLKRGEEFQVATFTPNGENEKADTDDDAEDGPIRMGFHQEIS